MNFIWILIWTLYKNTHFFYCNLFLPLYVSFSSCRCTRFIWFSRTRFRLTFCGHVVCCYGLNDDFYFFHKRVVNVWSHYRPKIQINNIWLTLTTPFFPFFWKIKTNSHYESQLIMFSQLNIWQIQESSLKNNQHFFLKTKMKLIFTWLTATNGIKYHCIWQINAFHLFKQTDYISENFICIYNHIITADYWYMGKLLMIYQK